MLYSQRSRHGVWKYRRAIPQGLKAIAGKSEIIISLQTKDDQKAQVAYVKTHGATEKYLNALSRVSNNPKSGNNDREMWEVGQAFLRSIKMPYVPLDKLRVQDEFDE